MVEGAQGDANYVEQAATFVRTAREARGVTLLRAANDLHIPIEQLEALERGDFSSFAAEIYARGAYTQYAVYLGLNSEQAQRAVLRALSSVRVITPLKMHTPQRWFERMQNPRLVAIAAGACASLIVGGYIVWQLRLFWQLPTLTVVSPTERIIEDDHMKLTGVSEAGVKLSVNGEPFLMQADATFELNIDLHPGINIIRLEAQNAAGRSRIVEQHYLRPREPGYL